MNEFSPRDIVDWASARRQSRCDAQTGVFQAIRFTSSQQELEEWRFAVLEIDASIAEYRGWLHELVPRTGFADRKGPIYWERIVALEQFKQQLQERMRELDADIAQAKCTS